jgi:hypothetical protein
LSIVEADARFRPEARTTDAATLLRVLRADGLSFFRRLSSRHRRAIAELRLICRDRLPRGLESRVALLETLRRAQEARRVLQLRTSFLSSTLGLLWAEEKTSWSDARALVAWVRGALSELGGTNLIVLAARTQELRVFSDFADALQATAQTVHSTLDELQQTIRADTRALFGCPDHNYSPITQLAARALVWRESVALINEWVAARKSLEHLNSEGLGAIADRLSNGTIDPKEAHPITDLLISETLWQRAAKEDPELFSIEGDVRNEQVERFRELDQQRIRLSSHEVLGRYLDQRPNGSAGEMGIIRAEIEKKRGHRAMRKLMLDAGSAVQRLKPIFLMSPLSVAQFLPPGRLTFDLIVIDEASQVTPEDAFGAMARAKQIIVVGDDKQLPPTNFFKIVNAGDDDDGEDDEPIRPDRPSDFESILTLSRAKGMTERMLAWHYRSKHPSLIALSNHECYADRLLLPPSPFAQTSEFGLSFVQTARGHYDRGGTSRDLVQANEVAKAVAEHVKAHPNKSLGVACLSVQQRDAVEDMIDKSGIRSEVEAFAPKAERLFVKNLEAVQGGRA